MAEIKPFKPLRFTQKAGDIADNVCPPYDIVDPKTRNALLDRSPYNLIQLELPEETDSADIGGKNSLENSENPKNKYKTAGNILTDFIKKGILKKDDEEGFFIYEEEFCHKGSVKQLDGIVCLCRTYDFSEQVVLPHEETLSKAKQDRFDLMSETFCNFSSVYSLFIDKNAFIRLIIDKYKTSPPINEFTDGDNVTHRLWKIVRHDDIAAIRGFFADKRLFIADGHHRYETAGVFNRHCAKNNINADSSFVMMTLVDMDSPGLVVFPTHRVVTKTEFDIDEFLKKAKEDFTLTQFDVSEDMEKTCESAGKHAFALYAGGSKLRLLKLKENSKTQSGAVGELDVSVLHTKVFENILGFAKEDMALQKNLIYTRSVTEAKQMVDDNRACAAFILNPTRVEEIKNVALEGSKMPQKSTYFYPKLITGLLINSFKDL